MIHNFWYYVKCKRIENHRSEEEDEEEKKKKQKRRIRKRVEGKKIKKIKEEAEE